MPARRLTGLLAALAMAGCTGLPQQQRAPVTVEALMQRMGGLFSNAAQMAALPDGIGREPAFTGEWVDPVIARFQRLPGSGLGDAVIYQEWRRAGNEAEIVRQRIWSLAASPDEEGVLLMAFYTLPGELEERFARGERPTDLLNAGLLSYPPGCRVRFERVADTYLGFLNPDTCVILSRSSRRPMRLEAHIRVDENDIGYRETGYLDNGEMIYRMPGIGEYELVRIQ